MTFLGTKEDKGHVPSHNEQTTIDFSLIIWQGKSSKTRVFLNSAVDSYLDLGNVAPFIPILSLISNSTVNDVEIVLIKLLLLVTDA